MKMLLSEMLLLGDPRLYERSHEIRQDELPQVEQWARGLDSIILQFQEKYGAGRGVAAPQMGIMKRLVCLHINAPVAMINPVLFALSDETIQLWDDCMCFPNLLVKVRRHKYCKVKFRDLAWQEHVWDLEDDMSELLQHEVDHLDGILATQRAIDKTSFKWRS